MICPYCKSGKNKLVDQDVTIESFCVIVDFVFKCDNCGKESILHFEDGEWQDTDYVPIEGADD